MIKTQEAYAALFLHGGLFREPAPIDGAFTGIRIHGEVAHLKRCQVLKEMAALGWRDAKISKAGFDDGAGCGNLVPLDGDSKPGIIRSPTPHSNQQVGTILGDHQINIADFSLGRRESQTGFAPKEAIAVVHVDDVVPEAILVELRKIPAVETAKAVRLF